MQVKRFVAADMRRALELVRQEMGPDAIILSSSRTKQGVEIITSCEAPVHERAQRGALPSPLAKQAAQDDAVPMPSDVAWGEESLVGRLMQRQGKDDIKAPRSAQAAEAARDKLFGKSPAQLVADIEAAEKRMKAAQKQNKGINARLSRDVEAEKAKASHQTAPKVAAKAASPDLNYRASRYEEEDFATDAEYQRQLEREMQAAAQAEAAKKAASQAHAAVANEQARPEVHAPQGHLLQNAYGTLFQPNIGKVSLNFDPSIFMERPPLMQVEEEWQPETKDEQAEFNALKSELADMRELLQTQLERLAQSSSTSNNASAPVSTVKATLQRRLQRMGLGDELANSVLEKIKTQNSLSDSWAEVLATLSHQLPTQGQDIVDKGGFFAFVGPTGAGKTTTLSKLAARFVLKHGTKGVALVTLDAERIGGAEPLQRLGKILKVPVHTSSIENLPMLLQELCAHRLVLIDTQGLRYGDEVLKRQLVQLRNLPQVRSYLVMATNTQTQLMKASVHAYKNAKLAGCILSKLDETVSLGEALGVVMEAKLAVAYSTAGQEIPKDISVARAHQLITKAVSLLKENQAGQADKSQQKGSIASIAPVAQVGGGFSA